MTELQDYRILELETQVDKLERQVRELESLRDQLLGMSTISKWGLRALFVLAGAGGISLAWRLVQWLNSPMSKP